MEAVKIKNNEDQEEQAYLHDLPLPICFVDDSGVISFANQHFLSFVQSTPRKVLNKKFSEIIVSDYVSKGALLKGVLEQHQSQISNEIEVLINNEQKTIVLKAIPHPSLENSAIFTIQDLSIEHTLHVKYRKKLDEIKSKSVEVIQIAKVAGLGELAVTMAHDTKNILAGLLGRLDLVGRKTEFDEKSKTHFDKAQFSAQRINRLMMQIMHFARASSRYEYVDIEEVIQNSMVLIESKTKHCGADITYNYQNDLPKIRCNGPQIEQVIMNLIGNACDAFDDEDYLKERKIDIIVTSNDSTLNIEIKDNGTGIPEEIQEKVLQAFYTSKPEGKGTGLGLSIVKQIVEIHEGKLSFKTEVGKGTSFFIELPLIVTTTENADPDPGK